MSHSLVPLCQEPVFAQIHERSDEESSSWGSSIINFLTGRVCQNWQSILLIALTVYHVIQTVLCIFSGHWTLALFSAITAGACSMVQNTLLKHASWQKKIDEMGHQIGDLELNNHDYQGLNDDYGSKLERMGAELASLRTENGQYKTLNDQHTQLLDNLGGQIERMSTALAAGEAITTEAAHEMRQNAQLLQTQLTQLPADIQSALQPKLAHFTHLAYQLGSLSVDAMQQINTHTQQLAHLDGQLLARNAQLAATSQQLQEDTRHLRQVRQEQQAETEQLRQVRQDLQASTAANVASAAVVFHRTYSGHAPGFKGIPAPGHYVSPVIAATA